MGPEHFPVEAPRAVGMPAREHVALIETKIPVY